MLFLYNNIRSITLPSTLKEIGKQAFAGNSLSYVKIPENVTTIGKNPFIEEKGIPTQYVKREGQYIYELPKEIETDKLTSIIGYVDDEVKTITFNANKKMIASNDLLTKIIYRVTVGNSTVSSFMEVFLSPELKKHHVILKDYDGTVLEELDIDDGQALTDLPELSREGYTFIGWDHIPNTIQEDITITAQYKAFPTIAVTDIKMKQGSSFNPLDYILVNDADGNKIKDIVITKNDVNINKEGTYIVEFKVTDQWGGVTKGSFNVEVYTEAFKDIQIKDNDSQITASGVFQNNSQLIVSLVESTDNVLYDYTNNQIVLGSYEVKIIGDYKGKIKIDFPIDMQYEGYTVYIRHMKKDGTVELYTRVAENGKVSIEVDELSPFIITIDKPIINEDDNKKEEENIKNEVKTNDTTSIHVWVHGLIVTGLVITFIYKRKTDL